MAEDETGSRTARASKSRIAALVACVPSGRIENAALADQFEGGVDQVIKMTGVHHRHVVSEGTTTSDLCAKAAETLFERSGIDRKGVDAVLFFTQTPDYRLPATACALQDRLALRTGIVAFDVNLGCSAYPYALWLASMMIETGAARKVLLLVGDTVSRIVAPEDRATALLFGDCGTATLVEACDHSPSAFVLGTDGAGAANLIVPEGCFRPTASDSRNTNPPDKLFMEGGEIFNFTLKAVPKLVGALQDTADGWVKPFDSYLFHQANAFMINHLRKKAKLLPEQVPLNIDRYGNTSSASIPLLIATEKREQVMTANGVALGMFGFGVGYSWAAAGMTLSGLACADVVPL